MDEKLGIAGSGAIACGLAAAAARHGQVVLWARSPDSARRAQAAVAKACGKISGEVNAAHVSVETDLDALGTATAVIEAVVEDPVAKAGLWGGLAGVVADEALLASTTSSLSVQALGAASGAPERFVGLHVFNPVPKMQLVELAFPVEATERTRQRAQDLCAALGKTAVAVPDIPGFVVNRLLFPYLFSAVTLQEESGLSAEAIDTCMQLGAGHPMGPLALLDFVGLDVAQAIGEAIGAPVPATLTALVEQGALGRKTGRGFYDYD
ncbi:3-hydroxyacyl-CoA dehydrogenase family protein [Baekduia soli]|uniref:3-hydroxyacyl-CoA dehydrogenase family protein n=1 Tax=Baekduia soli TaxID=496014 RepID=A0A5B8UAJ6_9ACTN|nr:3-hydroxyacyl-CoA dehydrogenase family protein [Baekduia soli]QEC50047.1 3-hydroxyacyl-CoA dehydrogenase family protein [Baekduia soli]